MLKSIFVSLPFSPSSHAPFKTRSKHTKAKKKKKKKNAVFIRTKHNMGIFGVIPFNKLQNDTKTTIQRRERTKNERRASLPIFMGRASPVLQ